MLKKTFFITLLIIAFTVAFVAIGAVLKINYPDYGEEIGYTVFLMVSSSILSIILTLIVVVITLFKKFF